MGHKDEFPPLDVSATSLRLAMSREALLTDDLLQRAQAAAAGGDSATASLLFADLAKRFAHLLQWHGYIGRALAAQHRATVIAAGLVGGAVGGVSGGLVVYLLSR